MQEAEVTMDVTRVWQTNARRDGGARRMRREKPKARRERQARNPARNADTTGL